MLTVIWCQQPLLLNFGLYSHFWLGVALTLTSFFASRPCDIFGDISYEELRAVAYQDSNLGMSQQAIVSRVLLLRQTIPFL